MITKDELKQFYSSLQKPVQGFIQMSDTKLSHIYTDFTSLEKWESLHQKNNFIVEASFFDGDRSITIRNINAEYLLTDHLLSEFSQTSKSTYLSKVPAFNVLMTQVWELQKDPLCNDLEVLTPTLQLFSGFHKETR